MPRWLGTLYTYALFSSPPPLLAFLHRLPTALYHTCHLPSTYASLQCHAFDINHAIVSQRPLLGSFCVWTWTSTPFLWIYTLLDRLG